MRSKLTPTKLLLAFAIPFVAVVAVYFGITAAAIAQRCSSSPPGPCWRDVTQESMWRRYRDGTDRQGRARKERKQDR